METAKSAAGRRVVDLDETTVTILRSHIGRQLLHREEIGDAYQDTGLVFPNPLGQPINPMRLTRAFEALAAKLGFKGARARLHNQRHFHATVKRQSGASLLLVSKRLGHASVSTTGDIYGHLLPGWQKEAAGNFAKALEEGQISDESELIRPTFYLAEGVRDWIVDYLKEEASQHPRWNLL